MSRNSEPSLFERLKTGLEEGIRFARGEIELVTYQIPQAPPAWDAADVIRLRKKLEVPRTIFASLLNVSPRTVKNWEEGRNKPTKAALRLLQLIDQEPDIVCGSFGLRNGKRQSAKPRIAGKAKRSRSTETKRTAP